MDADIFTCIKTEQLCPYGVAVSSVLGNRKTLFWFDKKTFCVEAHWLSNNANLCLEIFLNFVGQKFSS